MTEAAAFKNRGDPARLQCFNYGAGDAPSVGRPRPPADRHGWKATCALISLAHHSQTTSTPEIPPVAAAFRWMFAGGGFQRSSFWKFKVLKVDDLLPSANIFAIHATHSWFVTEKRVAATFAVQFATKVFMNAGFPSGKAADVTEAAFSPRSFPLKSH